MTFKLSAFPPYKNAIDAKHAGDLATARVEFEECVEAVRVAGGNPTICALLFWLGDVEAMDAKREVALERYDEAIAADPDSPLALIYYAESLFRRLGEPTLALEKLQAAEALLVSGRWHETDDDLSQEQYTRRIAETRVDRSKFVTVVRPNLSLLHRRRCPVSQNPATARVSEVCEAKLSLRIRRFRSEANLSPRS